MNAEDYYYHWTHRDSVAGILATGLDPSKAEGKWRVVWMCEHDKVGYGLGHIAYRHSWNADEMVLLRFPKKGIPFACTAWKGIYTTTERIRLKAHSSLKCGVLGEWVTARSWRKRTDTVSRTDPDTNTPNPSPPV